MRMSRTNTVCFGAGGFILGARGFVYHTMRGGYYPCICQNVPENWW